MNAPATSLGDQAGERIALFGGIYNNHIALAALLEETARRGIANVYCLGDLGGFGPHPDKVFPILRDAGVKTMQGNYDNSVGHDKADCQCGYTDPRDNYFARLSYQYTHRNTSLENKAWMRTLPDRFDYALEQQIVSLSSSVQPNGGPVTLVDRAIFLDPAWHYANWPQTGDQAWLQSWFETYVAEDHPVDLNISLGLQPSWPP